MPSAWLTNFIASLEASPTERQPTTQELAADIIRRSNRYRYNLPTVGSGLGSGGLVSKPSPVQKGPSTIQRVLDIVSRPLYGTMEAFKQDIKHGGLIDNPFTKDRPEELKAILGGAALGWAGKRKTTAADVYEEAGFSNEGKGAFVRNLATDAVLDPLNAVPFGWLLRAGRSASKTTTAAERVERALGSPVVPSGRTSYGRATRMPGREAEMAPEGTIFTPESPRRPLELTTGAERYGGGAVGNALLRTARFNRRTDLPNRRSIDLGGGTTRPPVEIAPPVDPIPAALERTRNLPRGLPNKRSIDLGGGQVREPSQETIKIYRSEARKTGESLDTPGSIGVHWTTKPIHYPYGYTPERQQGVVWHAEVSKDAIDTSVKRSRREQLAAESEGEVLLKPGAKITITGRTTRSKKPGTIDVNDVPEVPMKRTVVIGKEGATVQEVLADVIPKPTRQIDVEKLGVPPRAIEEPRKFRLDVDKISKIEIARALGPKGARTSEEYTAGKAAVDADAKVPVYGLNGQPTGTVNAKQLEEYIRTGKAPIPKESEIPDMTGWSEARSNRFWSKYLVPDKRSLDELHVLNDGVPVSIKAIRQRVLATKKAKKLKDVLPEEVAVTKPANTTAWRKAAKEAGLTRGEIDKVLKAGNDDEALALLREFADKPLDIPAAPAAVASATNDVFDTASLPTFEIADAEDIVEAVAEGSQTATKAMAEAVEANRPRQIPGIIDERGGRAIAKVAEQTVKNIKQGKTYGYPRANPFFNPAKQVNAIKRLEAALVDEGFLDGFTKISKTGKYNASTGKVADARRSALMKHLESFEDAMIAAGYPPTNYAGVPIRLSDLIQAAGGIHVVMAPKGLHLTDLFGDPKKFEAFLSANPEAAQLVEKAKAAHAAYTADLVNKGKEAALSAAQKAEIDPTRTATEVATALHEAPSVAKEVVKALSSPADARAMLDELSSEAKERVLRYIDGMKNEATTGYKIPNWLKLKEFASLTDEEALAIDSIFGKMDLPKPKAAIQKAKVKVGPEATAATDAIRAEIKDLATKLVASTKTTPTPPSPEAVRIAAEHVKALIDGAKPSVTKIAEKDAPVLTDVVSSGRTTVASTKTAVAMHRAALKTAGVEPTDIAREVSKAADSSAARGLLAGLMKAFNPAFENADLHPYLIENKSLFQTRTAEWSKALGATFRKYNAAQRTEAFSALQKGLPVGDDTTRAAAIEFEKAIDSMLGTTGFREAATSDVVREAITMGEINHILKLHKAKFRFVDEIVDDLGRPVKLERWTDSWKYHNLDGEDPVQFLKQMRDAVDQIMMEKTIFDNMTTVFGKVTGKTQFQHPRLKGVEFDPEIRPQVARFMEIWDELHKPNSKLAQQYDQILRLWKSGVTIYSPSHHVRNLVGDVSLAWLAGVNNPRVYQKAAKVLKAKRGMYEDMEQIDELVAPGGQKRALSRSAKQKIVRVAGRDLDAEQIWQIAFDRGLLPHSKVVEDIPTGVREAKIPQPLGGKGRKIARQTSETREHYVRLAHFIDSLSKYKGKNIEEAIDQATRVTRKWHPDGLDLTEFEHRVMRRAFPFYSWTRKAIPLILEGAVKKPAKIIAPNKAIYNLQVSMGLDPESLSEPFPEGMQFPDWIRDMSFGPVTGSGKIVGQNLLPFLDLPEDLANDPQRGIAGMLTPAVRLPGELLSQNVWQTGQPFESMDKSEYIDKQVPLLSVANRLAGTNLGAGSVEAAITGDASAMIDHKKLEGTESPSARRDSFLNYLFAAGIIDTQSPANLKSAEFDQRDRVAEFRRKLREKAGG